VLTASAVFAGGRFVRLALLLKPVNRKDGTAKNPKVACRAVDFNRPPLLLKRKIIVHSLEPCSYGKRLHCTSRYRAGFHCAVSLTAACRSEIRTS
jgi:hypothetical protein